MSACEYCWNQARLLGIDYGQQLARAEAEHAPCTQNTSEGARMRAGQFWDEEKQVDSRTLKVDGTDPPTAAAKE